MKHTLLFIDDESDNLDALERVFRKNYIILRANSGSEALELIKSHPHISVIISDQRMPEMTGVEFFQKSMETHGESVRILLTGYTDLDSVISAINSGQVYRYITKPWDTRELQITVAQAVEKFELEGELKIKNKELEKAFKELQILDQAKSQFMVLINHELKTPLTTLISFLELLKQTKLDEDQTKYTSRIEKSSNRLHEIILDSLELVSSELGKVEVHKTKMDIQDTVQNCLLNLKSEMDNKKINIEMDLQVRTVASDSKILNNILKRILKNAIQHGFSGKTVSIRASETNDSKITFEIINEGKEISADTIEHILKPFSLNENIMNHSKGLGLGLSICQSLLKHLDSNLEIQSFSDKIHVRFSI